MENKRRLTLEDLPIHIPTPDELYAELISSKGWSYTKNDKLKERRA
jgi:hypothetical protein